MEISVKERIKTELDQAQSESKQRVGRIGDILKAAASLTYKEIKEGSSELNVATRKSVAEIIEDLHEAPKAIVDIDVDDAKVETPISANPDENISDAKTLVPTWKTILQDVLTLVRDRKGDWFQASQKSVNNNAIKFDQDMTDEYGDRYLKARNFFQRVFEQIKSQRASSNPETAKKGKPVTIEVMDGDVPIIDVTPTVQPAETEVSH